MICEQLLLDAEHLPVNCKSADFNKNVTHYLSNSLEKK